MNKLRNYLIYYQRINELFLKFYVIIERSSKGRTQDFDSWNSGSIPFLSK